MIKKKCIKTLLIIFLVASISVAGDSYDKKDNITILPPPQIEIISFESKKMIQANIEYNKRTKELYNEYIKEIKQSQKKYKENLSKSENIYISTLKTNLDHNNQSEQDKKLIKKEIERITKADIDKDDNDKQIDKSGDFEYNKILTYIIKPSYQWVKIANVKKDDVVIFQVSGKISKDITKTSMTNYKAEGCKTRNTARPHYSCFRLSDDILRSDNGINKIKEQDDIYQGTVTVKTSGPLFFGFRYKSSDYGLNPSKNGKGALRLTIKIKNNKD